MKFLDSNGVAILWSKIKQYVGEEIGDIIFDWNDIINKPTWLVDGNVNWDDIVGKPSTFTPSSHTHTISDITNFPTFATINGQSITNGGNIVIDIDGGVAGSVSWDNIFGMPAGVVTSVSITGSGNAVTNATFSNHTLTLTKGSIETGTVDGITQTTADGRYIKRSGDSEMTGDYTFSSSTSITAGSFYESSDINLKENIASIIKKATNAVDCLAFKQFNFKNDEDKTTKYGVIAQEVEAVGLGNLVKENEEGKKSVDYISLLILKTEALERRVAELEAERR